MGAVLLLARSGLRQRARAFVGLAVVVALGIGAAVVALTAAWRTDHAYPDYLRRADVGDVVVNPSVLTDRIVDVITSTPGVLDATSDTALAATPDDGTARTQREVDSGAFEVRSSADGRYLRGDRPVVHAGRMIRSGSEAFLGLDAAATLDAEVGDEIPLAFWTATVVGTYDAEEVVEPVGRTTVRVVGIGVLADEVLPDELYPRQRILVTPEVAAPFDCTPPHPPADDRLTLDQLLPSLAPAGCSKLYRYLSLRVEGGDAGVSGVAAALSQRFAEENARLPSALRESDFGFFLIPTATAEEAARVQRSLEPSVTALQLLGLAAAASTLVVVMLAGLRMARRAGPDSLIWHGLGLSRAQRAAVVGIQLAIAGAGGLAGALVVGWLGSGIGPVASARALRPDGRLGVPTAVALPMLVGSAVLLACGFALAARAATVRSAAQPRAARPSALAGIAAQRGGLSFSLGVRAALGGGRRGGTGPLLGACGAALAAVVATLVFSTNLSGLVSSPARYGWPYDVAAVIGSGYGGADENAIAASLDRPEVQVWGVAALPYGSSVNGETMPAVAGRRGFDDLPVELVAGALPRGVSEVALGARSAERLSVAVGDEVLVSGVYGERPATVSGLVVLPPVGPYLSDRAGLGTGVLMPAAFIDEVYAGAERAGGLPLGTLSEVQGAFVAIDLRPGTDSERFVAGLDGEVDTWGSYGPRPVLYPESVRPAQIADVAAMRAAPGMVAGLLAAALVSGLALALTLAVRSRRRELAVLRALGCSRRQLRATLRWQALAVMTVGLAAGIPSGLAIGRSLWRVFAQRLAVEPTPAVPAGWLVLVVVVALGVAVLAAGWPGHLAGQVTPTTAPHDS